MNNTNKSVLGILDENIWWISSIYWKWKIHQWSEIWTSLAKVLSMGNIWTILSNKYHPFQCRRGQNTLKLKFTNASDAGDFECQVSTNPKISQVFKLTVVGKKRLCMTWMIKLSTSFSNTLRSWMPW